MFCRRSVLCSIAALLVVAGCSSSDGSDGSDGAAETSTVASTTIAPVASDPPATDPPAVTEAPASTDAPAQTNAPATVAPAETAAPASYDFSAIEPIVAAFVTERGLNGAGLIVVDADDGVVHEGYWGEFTPDRISLVASSSKMITAGVLLRLQDDGLLDIDAPVAEVVDWGAGNPDITPAQLLSNSSGLVGLLPNPAYAPYLCQYISSGTLEACGAAIFQTSDDDADIVAPDTEFRYGGAQWQVAGAVAEAASGKSWTELVEEIYVEPCGLETLGYNNHFGQIGSGFLYPVEFGGDPSVLAATANPNMEGGAYITTGDYAKLLLMHLRGGKCGDTQVLSQDALDTMHADRVAAAYDGSGAAGTGYGMGWWIDRTIGRISDAGAYGSVPWLDLEDGYGAYLVVESDAVTGNELAGLLYDIIDAEMAAAG